MVSGGIIRVDGDEALKDEVDLLLSKQGIEPDVGIGWCGGDEIVSSASDFDGRGKIGDEAVGPGFETGAVDDE